MIAQSAKLDDLNSSFQLLTSGSGPSRLHVVLSRLSVSPCRRQLHVSKVVIEEDLVLPVGGTTTRVFNAVFFVHLKAFLQVCARLTGQCRVLAGGSTVG